MNRDVVLSITLVGVICLPVFWLLLTAATSMTVHTIRQRKRKMGENLVFVLVIYLFFVVGALLHNFGIIN